MIGSPKELASYILSLDKDKQYEIKEYIEKRSLDANSYMWVLCTKIAEVIKSTKEEVYRNAIKQVGIYQQIEIDNCGVDTFIKAWGNKRKGWICEIESSNETKTRIFAYYGSSVYNKRAMSVLIDHIVEDAKELDIETLTPSQILDLKSKWKNEVKND